MGKEAQGLGSCSVTFSGILAGNLVRVEQLSLELMSIWDVSLSGSSFPYNTVPPLHICLYLLSVIWILRNISSALSWKCLTLGLPLEWVNWSWSLVTEVVLVLATSWLLCYSFSPADRVWVSAIPGDGAGWRSGRRKKLCGRSKGVVSLCSQTQEFCTQSLHETHFNCLHFILWPTNYSFLSLY